MAANDELPRGATASNVSNANVSAHIVIPGLPGIAHIITDFSGFLYSFSGGGGLGAYSGVARIDTTSITALWTTLLALPPTGAAGQLQFTSFAWSGKLFVPVGDSFSVDVAATTGQTSASVSWYDI